MSFNIEEDASWREDRTYRALKANLDGTLLKHSVLKQVQDIVSLILGFTVSQIIANEARDVLKMMDDAWWPPVIISASLLLTAVLLLFVTINLAHVDRERERRRELLKGHEVRARQRSGGEASAANEWRPVSFTGQARAEVAARQIGTRRRACGRTTRPPPFAT